MLNRILSIGCAAWLMIGGCRPDFGALTEGEEEAGGRGGHSGSSDGGLGGLAGATCDEDCGGAGTASGGAPRAGRDSEDGGGGSKATGGTGGTGKGDMGGDGGGGGDGDAGAGGDPDACKPKPVVIEPPLLHYEFEEGDGTDLEDATGNGNDGLVTGGGWAAGRNGTSLELDAGEFATLPADIVTDLDVMTVAAWVRVKSNADESTLFDFGTDETNHIYLKTKSGAGLRFGATINDEDHDVIATTRPLPLTVWKHVAVVMDENAAALYIDGLEIRRVGITFKPSDLGAAPNNFIGQGHGGGDFAGRIDDFRIYDRALTHTEIAELAAPGDDYLYFPFDESCGRRIYDRSNKALVGELPNGGSWITGRVGYALDLNGDKQFVQLPAGIVSKCDDLTIAFWASRKTSNVAREHILDFGKSRRTFMYVTPQAPGAGLRFAIKLNAAENDYSAEQPLFTNTPLSVGVWQHVAVVIEAGTGRLYLNGEEKDSRPIAIKPSDLGDTMNNTIGRSQYWDEMMDADPFYTGWIDDLRISCRAFPPQEIAFLAMLP